MIIDTHTHFYDPTRPQGVPWPPPTDPLLYRTVLPTYCQAVAASLGVTGTVVVEASQWLEDNQWVLDLARAEPFIVGFVGCLIPNRTEFAEELQRFVANPLFRGIRCGGRRFDQIDQPGFQRDMALLAEYDLVLDVLIDSQHWAAVLQLAHQLPHLRIVINHIGSMPITGEAVDVAWLERYAQAAAAPNVFMKVSGLLENSVLRPASAMLEFYRPTLDALWATFGADRLIYGSNWPVCEIAGDYATCIKLVKGYFAEKGTAATAKYFWQNAQQVYKFA